MKSIIRSASFGTWTAMAILWTAPPHASFIMAIAVASLTGLSVALFTFNNNWKT